jgi:sugar phosphate isomerase/epimerase
VHQGTLVSSASAAYLLVRDLVPEAVGVQLDPGNQRIEGQEDWRYGVGLLGKHLASVGIKDVVVPEGKWVECGKGHVEWIRLFAALKKYQGNYNLMPFYSEDPAVLRETLKREVAFVRSRAPEDDPFDLLGL